MMGHWHTPDPAPLVTHAPGHGGLLASIALCGTEPGRDVLAMSEIRAAGPRAGIVSIHVDADDVMIPAAYVTPARAQVATHARDAAEARDLLAMLGLGVELAWNVGGVA